jgi:hypothetical protein
VKQEVRDFAEVHTRDGASRGFTRATVDMIVFIHAMISLARAGLGCEGLSLFTGRISLWVYERYRSTMNHDGANKWVERTATNTGGLTITGHDGANKWVERTAAMRFGLDGDGLQTAVIAVVSTLPAAVAHPSR